MPAKDINNTQGLLSAAVALGLGILTYKMWARIFGEKKKTTLVDRNTKISLKLRSLGFLFFLFLFHIKPSF